MFSLRYGNLLQSLNQQPPKSTQIYASNLCDIKAISKLEIFTQTYRRIRHASPHLVGAAVRCGTVSPREASRR